MARWRGGDGDDGEYAKFSKIRKKAKRVTASRELTAEFERSEAEWALEGGAFAARVVEVHKRYCFVSREDVRGQVDTRDVWLAEVARKYLLAERRERNFVAVGDRVLCVPAPSGEKVDTKLSDLPRCVIEHAAPRTARIARLDPHHPGMEHALAANMDQLLIVASYLHPTVKWGLIDRYLVMAEAEGIKAIIVLTKKDLLAEEPDGEFKQQCVETEAIYRSLGYDVFSVRANAEGARRTKEFKRLKELLDGKITLLSGHSGVGKSSVVNQFDPEIVQPVEENDDIFYKGRHTTTYASFIRLGTGGYVIDTPGIRSFTFHEKTAIELSHCFVEFRPLMGQCKFRECRHMDEPGCVVRDAVEAGTISKWRYRSYLGILLGATGREGRIRDLPLDE
jgi:ribosome biogenesis GTPase